MDAIRKQKVFLCILLAALQFCMAGCSISEDVSLWAFFETLPVFFGTAEIHPTTEATVPVIETIPPATETTPPETLPHTTEPIPVTEETAPATTAPLATEPQATDEEDLPLEDLPPELLELLQKNPETIDFVRNYPTKKDETPIFTLEELADTDTVPLLMQWDERWGYTSYADELMGISGCGPTCLSMVYIYLTGDTQYDPAAMAQFSQKYGFSVPGKGSSWSLISKGGGILGLSVTEIPLVKDRVFSNLELGNPIICIVGPGDFTTTGHFIVMTGCEDGKIKINDPNSRIRSEMLWKFEDIKGQIRNLWVCRA